MDLMISGIPCFDFSKMGKRFGMNGSSGKLIMLYVRTIQEMKRPLSIFENVPDFCISFLQNELCDEFDIQTVLVPLALPPTVVYPILRMLTRTKRV